MHLFLLPRKQLHVLVSLAVPAVTPTVVYRHVTPSHGAQ